jgi:hypothetical protein
MEIFSNKSERNVSYKNRNISYKSVSEISEFDEIGEDEANDFVLKKNKAPKSQHSKLNESSHSDIVSNLSNKDFEEKDEEKN